MQKRPANTDQVSRQELIGLRIWNQRLGHTVEKTPAALLNHMGAMQAQDYPMACRALGLRTGSTLQAIEKAMKSGQIIRTHVLRPTWHFVTAKNLRWMLALTSPRIRNAMRARLAGLRLTPAILERSERLLEKILKNTELTREEIINAYKAEGIDTGSYRSGHLLGAAELSGLICSGSYSHGKTTYALLDDRVKPQKPISAEAARKKLAELYLQGHGPASIADMNWWSGLSQKEVREAFESLGKKLIRLQFDKTELFALETKHRSGIPPMMLLPAYDEFTIAYRDRSAVTDDRHARQMVSSNGIFYPLILINGIIAGTWKVLVSKRKGEIDIRLDPFGKLNAAQKKQVKEQALAYAHFTRKQAEIRFR